MSQIFAPRQALRNQYALWISRPSPVSPNDQGPGEP
jgi:hypothetical protein